MPSGRLQQQFIRLWQCCEGQSQETTLNELADLLSCSRRHMRTLLNTMQQQGWLSWEAEAGRGKRSRLTFLYTGLALQQQRAEDLLEQDRIDQLVQLVGDKAAVRQMLVSHLGRSFRQGRHILRVLYYRPMKNLLPGTALRRSETHMARQIFSGLTRINEENGELEADIAHHWQQVSPLQWRFFYAPASTFTTAASWKCTTSSPLWNVPAGYRSTRISPASTRPRPGRWISSCRSRISGFPGCWAMCRR